MNAGTLPDRIDGVVLDAVGTLIEARPSVTEAYATAALRQGIAIDRVVVRQRFHRAFLTDELREKDGPLKTDEASEQQRWRRIVAEVLEELPDPDRAFRELWDHFGRPEAWRCFPDVAPFLTLLQDAGIPTRIASNFDGRLRPVVAGLPELAWLTNALAISSEVGHRKPSSAFYRAVLDDLGTDPAATLWVGDDDENDVQGPRRIGIASIMVDRKGAGAGGVAAGVPDLSALGDHLVASGRIRGGRPG